MTHIEKCGLQLLLLCQTFSYDFPKIRHLPKIFLRGFENVAAGAKMKKLRLP